MDEADRLAIGLLAHGIRGLIGTIGKLNALVATATSDEFLAEHQAIREDLLDLMTSLTRLADLFDPPIPPEESK